ncbi:hypothetical protein AVEN_16729-1 [Araneus ventricosus]|uniref:Uncharacterized protein n=1 Tax=Araneus ventricosus TaxID=182803 RepID=A0A4Y2GG92_ARAVE|nr:hypothetical protein AVEN_16729-1 [Araneus ventricosus]
MHLGSVFDHPLFGWSNYDGKKSPTTVLESRNMGFGYRAILFVRFRKACYRERVLFFSPTIPGGPNRLLFKGANLPSGKLATSPVRHCLKTYLPTHNYDDFSDWNENPLQ